MIKELKISKPKLEKVLNEVKTFTVKNGENIYKVNTIAPVDKINEAIELGKLFKYNSVEYLVKWLNAEGFTTTVVKYSDLQFELNFQ